MSGGLNRVSPSSFTALYQYSIDNSLLCLQETVEPTLRSDWNSAKYVQLERWLSGLKHRIANSA